jgi:hypothetical protein
MGAPEVQARVKATMFDGSVVEAEGLWQPIADRVAFERFSGQAWQQHIVGSRLSDEAAAFLAWRLLARSREMPEFNDWIGELDDLELEPLKAEDGAPEANPTGVAVLSASSQSSS